MIATQTTDPWLADLIAHAKPVGAKSVEEQFISSAEFAAMDVKHEWMIEKTMVRYEPMVLGGPKKALKTSVVLDLAFSLAAGFNARFLEKFEVKQPYRVGVISGESGVPTLQKKALAICAAKGLKLADLPIYWRFHMPQLSIDKEQAAIAAEVQEHRLDVMIFDPMYLALMTPETATNAGNVLQMGPLLKQVVDICLPHGCTPVLIHHTKKLGFKDNKRPLDLDDLSQSGFAEFARQWLLLSRRSDYVDGSGKHELWLRMGGSAGHSGLWGLDVDEGKTSDGLAGVHWKVFVRSTKDVKLEKLEQEDEEEEKKNTHHIGRIIKYLKATPEGDTKTGIKESLGMNSETVTKALEVGVAKGLVEKVIIEKGSKNYEGYKLSSLDESNHPDSDPDNPDIPDGQNCPGSD